jgi:hypothetical protein
MLHAKARRKLPRRDLGSLMLLHTANAYSNPHPTPTHPTPPNPPAGPSPTPQASRLRTSPSASSTTASMRPPCLGRWQVGTCCCLLCLLCLLASHAMLRRAWPPVPTLSLVTS